MLSLIVLFGSFMSCNQYWPLVDTIGKEAHEGMKNTINFKSKEVVLKKIIKFCLITIWQKDKAANQHYSFTNTAYRNQATKKNQC